MSWKAAILCLLRSLFSLNIQCNQTHFLKWPQSLHCWKWHLTTSLTTPRGLQTWPPQTPTPTPSTTPIQTHLNTDHKHLHSITQPQHIRIIMPLSHSEVYVQWFCACLALVDTVCSSPDFSLFLTWFLLHVWDLSASFHNKTLCICKCVCISAVWWTLPSCRPVYYFLWHYKCKLGSHLSTWIQKKSVFWGRKPIARMFRVARWCSG